MADRQTALAVFDFLDSLRAGQYRIGADAEKDHATAGLLASLSGDTGLRDAVCAKLISPGMERADAVLSGAQRVEKIEYGQCGLPVSHVQPPEE